MLDFIFTHHLVKWDVRHWKIEHLPRTYNAIEVFHRGFESMLQYNKTNVWKILEVIHRQQALQEFTVAQKNLEAHNYKSQSRKIKKNCLCHTEKSAISVFATNCFKSVIWRSCFNLLLLICVIVLK